MGGCGGGAREAEDGTGQEAEVGGMGMMQDGSFGEDGEGVEVFILFLYVRFCCRGYEYAMKGPFSFSTKLLLWKPSCMN